MKNKNSEVEDLLPSLKSYWVNGKDGTYKKYLTFNSERLDEKFSKYLSKPEEVVSEKEYFKRQLEGKLE